MQKGFNIQSTYTICALAFLEMETTTYELNFYEHIFKIVVHQVMGC